MKKSSKKKSFKANASNRKIGMDRDPSEKEAGPHRIEIRPDGAGFGAGGRPIPQKYFRKTSGHPDSSGTPAGGCQHPR